MSVAMFILLSQCVTVNLSDLNSTSLKCVFSLLHSITLTKGSVHCLTSRVCDFPSVTLAASKRRSDFVLDFCGTKRLCSFIQ